IGAHAGRPPEKTRRSPGSGAAPPDFAPRPSSVGSVDSGAIPDRVTRRECIISSQQRRCSLPRVTRTTMATIDPGAVFADRFDIDRLAGSGGMGAVYRARDRRTGDMVALKILHAVGPDSDAAERFAREARLLGEMKHPGIVAYVAHGET